ncbi:hypothetical protein [Granulicella sp. L60]|uniref:hypothetical protein n=1 Tax=Granulicella sp. L60 TaxID=1641866 RepID=UPI00131A9D83|nr:hypothetical protein [Granulicella sp. L60]
MSAIIRNGVLLLLGAALSTDLLALAQQKPASTYTSDVDVVITYVAERAKVASVDCGCFWLNGGGGNFAITLFHGLGVAADLTGEHASNIGTGTVPTDIVPLKNQDGVIHVKATKPMTRSSGATFPTYLYTKIISL